MAIYYYGNFILSRNNITINAFNTEQKKELIFFEFSELNLTVTSFIKAFNKAYLYLMSFFVTSSNFDLGTFSINCLQKYLSYRPT